MRGPSFTARGVAQARQRLSRPSSAEGDVTIAERLECDLHGPFPLHFSRTFSAYIAARTAFFDDRVAEATGASPGQVVILGAGYDDRGWRFRTSGIRFVEVDHPETQRDKLARLGRLGVTIDDITSVPIDFAAGDDALVRALTNVLAPDLPTLVLCEGLLPYLPRATIESVLRQVASCPGSSRHLAAELPIRPTTRRGRALLRMLGMATAAMGEPVLTVFDTVDDAKDVLRAAGWQIEHWCRGGDIGMRTPTRDLAYVTASA